ncbi:RagB/SusD family nutrient uptake outer membrane protein [Chitinophaga horti]|uniref:RagB/SusD family nutrient uptake outer membrane protein n=1 Tax=Chitinophaga horti TaxID=2920382 RepID=A0ABY6IYQ0_9BACT|nr:RagB/SusD family nutrient uptake outer membrane protein [Chitinophaga horti]UYQ92511.1 RagB/SusD family nutrient uptake outer membrane protein [Chitinophaga horti]
MRFSIKYTLLIVAGAVLTLSSCSKWLDVSPKTQVREDKQFSTRQGFIDALFGMYQLAAGDSLYGRNLTFGAIDVLAGRYENKASGLYWGYWARATYTNTVIGANLDAEFTVAGMWGGSYQLIAQANYILKNIEGKQSMLGGEAYNIIKGESLAFRGFQHFELLRMFAPAYLNGQNAATKAIPYMSAFTINPQEAESMDAVLGKAEQDLLAAHELLAVNTNIDQIADNQGSVSLDLFTMYRQNHLNYWAVKAALARLYLYKGDKINALKYAREVIQSNKFRFIASSELNADPAALASDLTFSREHIFSVYSSGLRRHAEDFFKPAPLARDDNRDLYSTLTKMNAAYESSLPGYGTDIRLPDARILWTAANASGFIYTKKYYNDNPDNVKQKLVPVMRLPEMYYIAAEASATADEGLVFLNQVRTARGLPALTSSGNLNAEIGKEYRKEFYGEGQYWFYLKRTNATTVPDGVAGTMTQAKYTFPMPLAQIEFGK